MQTHLKKTIRAVWKLTNLYKSNDSKPFIFNLPVDKEVASRFHLYNENKLFWQESNNAIANLYLNVSDNTGNLNGFLYVFLLRNIASAPLELSFFINFSIKTGQRSYAYYFTFSIQLSEIYNYVYLY